jgi:hypothetical protein
MSDSNITKDLTDIFLSFRETLDIALQSKNASELLPELESNIAEEISKFSPLELGYLLVSSLIFISNIATCKACEGDNVKTAVVTARSIETAINESSSPYGLDIYDVGLNSVNSPTFKSKVEDLAVFLNLENLEPRGSC